MSIAIANKVEKLEERIAALEAAFSCAQQLIDSAALTSLPVIEPIEPRFKKIENEIQGIKMRMGKKGE